MNAEGMRNRQEHPSTSMMSGTQRLHQDIVKTSPDTINLGNLVPIPMGRTPDTVNLDNPVPIPMGRTAVTSNAPINMFNMVRANASNTGNDGQPLQISQPHEHSAKSQNSCCRAHGHGKASKPSDPSCTCTHFLRFWAG